MLEAAACSSALITSVTFDPHNGTPPPPQVQVSSATKANCLLQGEGGVKRQQGESPALSLPWHVMQRKVEGRKHVPLFHIHPSQWPYITTIPISLHTPLEIPSPPN